MINSGLGQNSKRSMMHEAFDPELLEKFYRHECSDEEIYLVEEWFVGLDHRKDINLRVSEEWENTPLTGKQKELLQDILYKIHFDLRVEEFEQEKGKSKIAILNKIFASVAVSVILVLFGLWLGNNYGLGVKNNYSEIRAPYGSRVHFELPDGSTGWLNNGSSLKYPMRFVGGERQVFLVGEGYFDVMHNSNKPFVVQTENNKVVALGTSFNVQAFKGDIEEEVTLIKGEVVVRRKLSDNKYSDILVMKPGQHVELNVNTGEIAFLEQEAEKYISWKDGKMVFRNDPLSSIINEMERFYNVDIEVKDIELFKYHFHATFEDETLYEALRLLTLSTPIKYKISKRVKNTSGTYEKRKIVLYIKNI